ncbi:hypothetical protein FJY90_07935 [Candidatus Gottesmanbacteria bacterium]|nr:hypothetical protein [Candidatus Gottesmanbacteria bacterium]
MLKKYNKIRKYFKEHVDYNGLVHLLAGIGVGILVTYPVVGNHPVRWGVLFLLIAVLGHLYPLTIKK